jgi:hypothetical protein
MHLYHPALENRVEQLSDGVLLKLFRKRCKSGSFDLEHAYRMGPNHVHASITHPDGTFKNLGISKNLLTNIGDMVLMGGFSGGTSASGEPAGNTLASNVSSLAPTGTTCTGTGSVWTASNLGTPTLGVAGWRVYAAPHTTTNPVVWGNIVSNTTNVLTIDQWWKLPAAAGGAPVLGTTPTNGDAFVIANGGIASACFMALTTDSGAASATHTTLASEITTGGCGRAMTVFARGSNPSGGSGTFTLQKAFSVTGTFTAIHRMGLFFCLTAAGADPMAFETVLLQDATVGNGDTLTVTDTITQSG